MIKALVFDLDGVITDSAEYHYQAWKQLGESIGIPFDRAFNEQLKGISRMDSLNKILEYGNKHMSQEEKELLATKKNETYLALIERMTENDVLPGILPLLKQAREKGLKIALASASKNGPFILERLGISDYFDTIVNPEHLTKGKPDPEIYCKAAEQLHVQAYECIGLEDAQSGIEGLNAAGMFSVGIGKEDILYSANYLVDTTEKLDLNSLLIHANK
ncbi:MULTISPECIES: beta-phosphoglucomutase [unclassified Granulicatella]|uniref:beta-phosphoglucomutase n=1 Tax=unclassified Granulicatella TaxID=2630493 RepID=UPI001073D61D|nr:MULTISPECIES: beta-phosphoglucomutase [unclassified Granulicatella]MBF0779657.1 beta-phosphoglucomutase [Granulicatella sp. 19428wC4_WM01]TFU96313.1 beta-phosphoglucomutase [Granulicatella sp. WM01]